MKIAVLCTNRLSINKETKKGTEVITRLLINELTRHHGISVTAFASGDSDLHVPIESTSYLSYEKAHDNKLKVDMAIAFELALLSKAFSLQKEFDLYHVNMGGGDFATSFAPFCKKPILVTLHFTWDSPYAREFFSLFRKNKNLFFVSVSDAQRKILPDLNFIATIHHGIETDMFAFDSQGGSEIIWAGRAIPEKGMETALKVAKQCGKKINLFAVPKEEHKEWFKKNIIDAITNSSQVKLYLNKTRAELTEAFQKSRMFLFPVTWEEPFGLVMVESMSCGTPVIAYARGAIPEVIKDGVTGFIINESENDIRGNWIIKKTGIEGLKEAVKRIYAMSDKDYQAMRKACRKHVEDNFTIEKMTQQYITVYKKILDLNR